MQAVLKEEYALKNVRVWFTKKNTAKYISHLDLNRCMARAIHRAKLPIWYTEGFNPHPFITFSLPLSLGIQGKRESMDLRLIDEICEKELMDRLNSCLPKDIQVFNITEQVMKPKEISYALFEIEFMPEIVSAKDFELVLRNFMDRDSIIVEKKTKSGIKEIDLKLELKDFEIKEENGKINLLLTLPAGNVNNINPLLFLNEFKKLELGDFSYNITRLNMFNKNLEVFK